jgi:hypothetical protein
MHSSQTYFDITRKSDLILFLICFPPGWQGRFFIVPMYHNNKIPR